MVQLVGIDDLSIYTPRFSLSLTALAHARGVDSDKYTIGLGQEIMSVMPPDEDIVSMGANAATDIINDDNRSSIRLLLFATESGVDQSKSAGIWVHKLLQLPAQCRVVELKQACYSATCALALARSYVRENPTHKVLIIASDNARYGISTAGEPTQGCAATAFIVSLHPRLVALEPYSGVYSEHIMDFWRPNYTTEAIVDGKYSTKAYLNALIFSWNEYTKASHHSYNMHARFCYHLPFTKMAEKAHEKLTRFCQEHDATSSTDSQISSIASSLLYSKQIGNGYTASLYMGLASLLENDTADLSNKRIGLFSYGSGCTSEFFSAIVSSEYKKICPHAHARHQKYILQRQPLTCDQYETFYHHLLPHDGSEYMTPIFTSHRFRLKGIKNHERVYERHS